MSQAPHQLHFMKLNDAPKGNANNTKLNVDPDDKKAEL